MFPYSDKYMTYDFATHRYILTSDCAIDELGVDLRRTYNLRRAANADIMLKAYLNRISAIVYGVIHGYNVNTTAQDFMIAVCAAGRHVIKEAMKNQLLLTLSVGDQSMSMDKEARALKIDDVAKEILYTPLPEFGTHLLYTGMLNINPPPYVDKEGNPIW